MEVKINTISLDVVILSHNRPNLLKRAMAAIDQTDFCVSVNKIVSDNSTNQKELEKIIDNNWNLKERNSQMSWIQHFIINLRECESDWILITNDDDEILGEFGSWFASNMINESIKVITGASNTVNGQGLFIRNEGYINRVIKSKIIFKEIYIFEEILTMQMRSGSLFPFSGIALKTEIIKKLNLENSERYGYAFDFFFALELCTSDKKNSGLIAYRSKKPIINYYIHGNQLSAENSIGFRLPGESLLCRLYIVFYHNYELSPIECLVLFAQILISRSVASAGNQADLLDLIDNIFEESSNLTLKFRFLKIANSMPLIFVQLFYYLYTINNKFLWKIRSIKRQK
jgi:hypothetical protein